MAVFQVGAPQGMIKDVNPTALPNEFFSHTENTRFEDNFLPFDENDNLVNKNNFFFKDSKLNNY